MKKIIINIALSVFLIFSVGTFLPMNMMLFFLILGILIIYNIPAGKFMTKNIRIIPILIFCLFILVYIFIPKKITGCNSLADAEVCSSIQCVGVPYLLGIPPSPQCIGKSWPVADNTYRNDQSAESQYCDYRSDWAACNGQTIKISGTNPAAGAGTAQHPVVAMPGQYQSYLDTDEGQIILLSKEEIDCPDAMTVIGSLATDVGPCDPTSVGKSMYCGLSVTVDQWECGDYYQQLADQCAQKKSPGCCTSSVETMEQNNYTLEPASGCPDGYQRNSLKCPDSFTWCEPVEGKENGETCVEDTECPDDLECHNGKCVDNCYGQWDGDVCMTGV